MNDHLGFILKKSQKIVKRVKKGGHIFRYNIKE